MWFILQGNTYWSMYINPYKYGFSSSSAGSYYDYSHTYEINDYTQRLDEARRASDNPAVSNNLDSAWQSRFGNEFSYANRNFGSEERKYLFSYYFHLYTKCFDEKNVKAKQMNDIMAN